MKWRSSALLLCVFSLVFSLFYGNVIFAASLTVHNVDTGLSYTSIQEAIDAPETLDGHTIFVEAGIYYENVVVNKSLTLAGEDKETTIIDGGKRENRHVVAVEADNTVVSNFTVRRCYPSLIHYGVYLFHTSNSRVHNNNFVDNWIGVGVEYSSGSQVSCNNICDCVAGIMVTGSSGSHVFSNIVRTAGQWGLHVTRSSGISIFCNNITDRYCGVVMMNSSNVSFLANNIVKSYYGVMLSNFSGFVSQNNILENDFGIWSSEEVSCRIYHNSFINNTIQAGGRAPYRNTWDDGYPSGGNYWNDYDGSDVYEGPFQNITGNDGIGDTPYIVHENNTDNYPLMQPYTCTHAVAATYVAVERTAIVEGLTVNIDVGIINYGSFSETFNLTVYLNTMILNQTEVNLTSINAATLTFTWNTVGFAKGNYTIKATATLVPGETDISDNNQTCKVIISMLGDITGPTGWPDGMVDMRDIGMAAQAFGSYPGHSRWNLEADITGPEYLEPDNNVDMRDIALIARHFGETDS